MKQGYITAAACADQRPAAEKNSVTIWIRSSSYFFPPDTGRSLCCICVRQKITARVLSGSLQVEVFHLACVDGGGDWTEAQLSPRSTQITGTIGQMRADKLSRVEWPVNKPAAKPNRLITFTVKEAWRRIFLNYTSVAVYVTNNGQHKSFFFFLHFYWSS